MSPGKRVRVLAGFYENCRGIIDSVSATGELLVDLGGDVDIRGLIVAFDPHEVEAL